MTILQVTPEECIEHEVVPGEESHPRLNTVEARRFIGGLANGERKRFESLVDDQGNLSPEQQEMYMIKTWSDAGDSEALAGHTTSRALQSVRHFFETNLNTEQTNTIDKRFYYPLLDMPRAPHIADMHWDKENRFRRGIEKVIANVTDAPEAFLHLPLLERGERTPWYTQQVIVQSGRVAMHNVVQVHEDGSPMGSSYLFTVSHEAASEITRTTGAPSPLLPQLIIAVDRA